MSGARLSLKSPARILDLGTNMLRDPVPPVLDRAIEGEVEDKEDDGEESNGEWSQGNKSLFTSLNIIKSRT